MVEDYKYLGIHIDNRLNWNTNIEAVYKKGISRLYFLRKLRNPSMCAAKCWKSSISLLWPVH